MTIGHVVDMWSEGDGTFRPHRPAWQSKAKCVGHTELFFNESDRASILQAKKICGLCPVRKPCLKHAIDKHESGIWGGTTPIERGHTRRGKVIK